MSIMSNASGNVSCNHLLIKLVNALKEQLADRLLQQVSPKVPCTRIFALIIELLDPMWDQLIIAIACLVLDHAHKSFVAGLHAQAVAQGCQIQAGGSLLIIIIFAIVGEKTFRVLHIGQHVRHTAPHPARTCKPA